MDRTPSLAENGLVRVLRAALIVLSAAFLLLFPAYFNRLPVYAPYRAKFERPAPDWYGRIELWHIVSSRPYQGSVTSFLTARANAYNALHPGVHIRITGMSEEAFAERQSRGEAPDGYSFQGGLLHAGQLSPLSMPAPAYAGTLKNAGVDGVVYAAPWYFSGYAVAFNTQRLYALGLSVPEHADAELLQQLIDAGEKAGGVCCPGIIAAGLRLTGLLTPQEAFLSGKCAAGVVDFRTFGTLTRDGGKNIAIEAVPFLPYTDQVQYLGIARGADEQRALVLSDFYSALLSPDSQRQLTSLGLMCASADVADALYDEELLTAFYAGCAETKTPDAFLYEMHKDALQQDALRFIAGEAGGEAAFFERFEVVLGAKS